MEDKKSGLSYFIDKLYIDKIRTVGFLLLISIGVYIYLFGTISYTADKCRSEYAITGDSITVNPGDIIGTIVFGRGTYLRAGRYNIRIDGYNEYTEYNSYQIYSESLDKEFSSGVFTPGMEIPIYLDEDVKDIETRVTYQDAGTVTVSKITITSIHGIKDYLLIFALVVIIVASYLFLQIKKETIVAKIVCAVLGTIGFVILVFVQFIFIEALYHNDTMYAQLQQWILASEKTGYLLSMSVCVLACVDIVIILICKYYSISVIAITILSGVYALVGYNYYMARGEAFTFEQLQLAKEANKVVSDYNIVIPKLFWLMVALSIVASVYLFRKKVNAKIYIRLGITIILLFLIRKSSVIVKKVIADHGDETVIFIANEYYDKVGYLVGTLVSIPEPMDSPDGYSKDAVNKILGGQNSAGNAVSDCSTPDIIYIQCESLFDLSKVQAPTWSVNPLEYLNELAGECYVGDFVSPMVGGGTANVEYEVLTGYNYFNTNGTPFINGIKNGQQSIISDLEDYGYETVVIHTNTGTFYNRDSVYSYLGADRMIFEEQLGETPEEYSIGPWANDRWAYEALIDDYENRDKTVPYFAEVVTTQNHGAYINDYDNHGITVDGDISLDENRELQTYLNLEQESMEAFKEVIDYFSGIDDDVIIVFYGDHCPALNYFGIAGDTMEFNIAMHETPLVIWNNYGAELSFPSQVSAYNLTPQLMKQLGMDKDNYMKYMSDNYVPVLIGGTVAMFDDGAVLGIDDLPEENREILENMWILQYDRVYGKKYSNYGD